MTIYSLIADRDPDEDPDAPQCRVKHPSTLDRCDLVEHPRDVLHWHRTDELRGTGYTWVWAAPRCPTHGLTLPCQGCAGDHLARAHLFGSHEDTCARCAIPKPTTPPAIDAASLAAADDTLIPEENAP